MFAVSIFLRTIQKTERTTGSRREQTTGLSRLLPTSFIFSRARYGCTCCNLYGRLPAVRRRYTSHGICMCVSGKGGGDTATTDRVYPPSIISEGLATHWIQSPTCWVQATVSTRAPPPPPIPHRKKEKGTKQQGGDSIKRWQQLTRRSEQITTEFFQLSAIFTRKSDGQRGNKYCLTQMDVNRH